MRYAIKFAYDGTLFSGSQRQPHQELRTVENEIITCLLDHGIIKDYRTSKFSVASRTDAKVSALGNVFAINTDFQPNDILNILNSKVSDCCFYGITRVDEHFKPRHAKMRWYRYHLFNEKDFEIADLRAITQLFVGSHNFKNFVKPGNSAEETVRNIDSIDVIENGSWILIDIHAVGFLWNQVRRLVSAWTKCISHEISKEYLASALEHPEVPVDLGLAPPEPLFLMDVKYDFEFDIDNQLLNNTIKELRRTWIQLNLKNILIENIFENIDHKK